ncbi:class I SAM-dependent methyltransferase [Thalassococcus sp. S3]|uniref:class I SAM-dependent methyltransferase n=1 Tax=Thalassococcus sp. S3 TaxID=2017482 RepID=UPI0010247785|nr:class I SAM-dependent methyltransferase [Thalassococcus sp. S3]QBF31372.1 ubiquinone biosynthesis protein UbiE [Thalassococcus sp. S3]
MIHAKDFWDGVAVKYSKQAIKDPVAYEHTLARTLSHLRPTDHVLELGAGTGSTALRIAPHVAQITATDISPKMMEIARDKAWNESVSNLKVQTADLHDPTIPAGPYDAVLAFNTLHLLRDIPGALARVRGPLKPGGLFISKSVCLAGYYHPFRLMIPLMQWIGKAPYVQIMHPSALEDMILRAGFEIVESGDFPAKPRSRYVVARKV